MKRILLLLVLLISNAIYAQHIRCYTNEYVNYRNSINPGYKNRIDELHQFVTTNFINNVSRDFEIVRIPVVVHVLYNNESQNLSDSLVQSQINILNEDFARLNPDTNLTRDIFAPVASATGIEFYLAQFDPTGAPTNGIVRKETDVNSFFSITDLDVMKSDANGGSDAWPTNQYLNIWVCNLAIPFLNIPVILGFATPPNGAPNWPDGSGSSSAQNDGVVIHYEVFGSNPSASGNLETVNRGRTLVHEVGHYLGLRHIWGDPGQNENGCDVDDGILDTPNAAAASQQTCDNTTNSCDEGSNDFPDMIENYMDYSDENCLNMFTNQQAQAMRFVVENFRPDLLLSIQKRINPTSLLNVYPNPATNQISIQHNINGMDCLLNILDMTGKIIQQNSISVSNSKIDLDISQLTPGVYFIELKTDTARYFCKISKF
jgi:hypothetical protein